MTVYRRGKTGIFWLIKRVPARYGSVEPRARIQQSLRTESRGVAERKGAAAWELYLARWDALKAGRDGDAAELHTQLVRICESSGFEYKPAAELALGAPLRDILARIDVVDPNSPETAMALLGGSDAPSITASTLFSTYADLTRAEHIGKSSDQRRKWKNDRQRAIASFMTAVGDIDIASMTRSDVMRFRLWLSGLFPTPEHVPYSLRHSFNDRLQNAGCPDSIRRELVGHAPEGTSYGEGVWLETAAAWISKIAI